MNNDGGLTALKEQLAVYVSDDELLRRVVVGCRSKRWPRWHHVMETFSVGSTVAGLICARFDLSADEYVPKARKRPIHKPKSSPK